MTSSMPPIAIAAAHPPRTGLRLGLTLVLGLLGTWLMPIRQHFFPGVLAEQHGPALLVWLAVAFAGVLLLHHGEPGPRLRRLLVFMTLIAALSLLPTPAPGMYELLDWSSLAKVGAIALLFLMAGASVCGMLAQPAKFQPWTVFLLRGPTLALASPLLLFASRPHAGTPGSVLLRSASAALLCALASPLIPIGRGYYSRVIGSCLSIDQLGLQATSFVTWAWCGCGVLQLLTPWPATSETSRRRHDRRHDGAGKLQLRMPTVLSDVATALRRRVLARPDSRRADGCFPAAVIIPLALTLLAVLKWKTFLAAIGYALLIVLAEWNLLALLLLLCPCLPFPRLARLANPAPGVRISALGTFMFMAMVLIPFALWCIPSTRCLLNGQLFTAQFNTSWVGWVLDRSTIQCGLWRFTYLTAMAMAYVAIARWAGDRRTRRGYWAFTGPTLAIFFCLLSYLTCVFYSLALYIHTLGFTTLRVYGMLYGVCCYSATVRFTRWAVQKPDREEGIELA